MDVIRRDSASDIIKFFKFIPKGITKRDTHPEDQPILFYRNNGAESLYVLFVCLSVYVILQLVSRMHTLFDGFLENRPFSTRVMPLKSHSCPTSVIIQIL